METVVIKLALPLENVAALRALMEEGGCDCPKCSVISEKDDIMSILGIMTDAINIAYVGTNEQGQPLPLMKPAVVLDMRIENRSEFKSNEVSHD